jgi:hypothetical protein
MTTLAELATLVSRKRGDLEEWAATGNGTTTTLVCNSLCIGGDNEYAGDEVMFTGRVDVPVRRVVSSTISDYTLTLAPALPTSTATSEAFEKRRRHLYVDVVGAINAAIRDIAPVTPQLAPADTSLVLVSDQFEYIIPASFKRLHKVEVDSSVYGYEMIDPLCWDMRPCGKLWIAESICQNYTGHALRLSGYTDPVLLSARTDVTPIAAPYILAYCDWYLLGQRSDTPPTMLDMLYKTREFERTRAMTMLLPNTKMVKL